MALLAPAWASAQDAEAGANAYRKCAACHAVGADATNGYGPPLNDIMGRRAGTQEGFSYSLVLTDAGRNWLVWTPEALSDFLADPRRYLPGNGMYFGGLADPAERAAVIAYLMTFSPGYDPQSTPPGRAPATD